MKSESKQIQVTNNILEISILLIYSGLTIIQHQAKNNLLFHFQKNDFRIFFQDFIKNSAKKRIA
jgi:hypothetical protein